MVIFMSSVATSLSIFLFVLWYARSKNQTEIRVRSLGEQERMVVDDASPFSQRFAFPLIEGMVSAFMRIMPTSLVGRSRKWLITAGEKFTPSQFYSVVLVTSTLIPATYFVFVWAGSSGSPSTKALVPVPLFALAGLLGPFYVIRARAKARQKKIWRSLPGALDLLTTCVEAGLSLDFALQRVAERYTGPLSDEIQRTLREIGLGRARREALLHMAERINLPDVLTFVNSIVQAEALGTSVGQVLRVQAGHMRLRRRQRAEQVARQAPVKMVFPLVFFLMPSLFIVTIGPVVLNVIDTVQK